MLHFLIRFISLHQPTHRGVVHAEMRRNGAHRMPPRQIRQRDRFVTLVRAGKFGQCPLGRSALRTGDFRERGLFVDQCLHFLDERFWPEVDLALQLAPHTGQSRALVNEGDVTFDRASTLCSKLRQHKVNVQPVRFGGLSARCRITAPPPSLQTPNPLGAQRVQHNVAGKLQQIAVFVNQNGFEAP